MGSPHVCGCDGKSASSHRQTLDEVDFERGIWAAARDGEGARVMELLGRGTHPSAQDTSGYTATDCLSYIYVAWIIFIYSVGLGVETAQFSQVIVTLSVYVNSIEDVE